MDMMKNVAFGVCATMALTGCVTSSGTTYHTDDPYQLFSSAGRGGFPIVIVGQPYPGRQPGVEDAVVEGFKRNFSTFSKPSVASIDDVRNQRLVIVFNAPGHPLPSDICKRANQMSAGVGGSAGNTVAASAVYCGGVEPYSSAWISLPTPAGPEMAEFRDAMVTLIREALPREIDPSRQKGNSDRRIG